MAEAIGQRWRKGMTCRTRLPVRGTMGPTYHRDRGREEAGGAGLWHEQAGGPGERERGARVRVGLAQEEKGSGPKAKS